jgi:hypothetical protein
MRMLPDTACIMKALRAITSDGKKLGFGSDNLEQGWSSQRASRSNGKHELQTLILLVDQPPHAQKVLVPMPVPMLVLELKLLQARLET